MKKDKYTITFFASSTENGQDLVGMIDSEKFKVFVKTELANAGLVNSELELHIIYPHDVEYNTIYFHIYQNKSDIVIFDASIETAEHNLLGDNYKCVSHAPYMNLNVFVVSRTVLPLNFIPHTTNVLPFGENFHIDNKGKLTPITSYDNESIVEFIKEEDT